MTVGLVWDLNLRANLVLWPTVGPNISALVGVAGQPYDETVFLKALAPTAGTGPADTRAVRNTFEVLAHAGLALRTDQDLFSLSPLGTCVFTFLGTTGGHAFVRPQNRKLVAAPMVRALGALAEVQAIWRVWRTADNRLSTEELNRVVGAMKNLEDAPAAAAAVDRSRAAGDVTLIGPRAYNDGDYGTTRASDQRKAINPLVLLASAGGLMIQERTAGDWQLEGWAAPLIDSSIAWHPPVRHVSTGADQVNIMSRVAGPPRCDP